MRSLAQQRPWPTSNRPLRSNSSACRLRLFLEDVICITGKLAIDAMDIAFAIHFLHRESGLICKPVLPIDRNHHSLLEKRHNMCAIIKFFARQRIDDDLEVAIEQTVV